MQVLCQKFVILLFILIKCSNTHVSLTFPEARYPPLDFLDTFRTIPLCGVPKSLRSKITNLHVGQSYKITWRMQYPHRGGFRLQLFNSKGILVQNLAPVIESDNKSEIFYGLNDEMLEDHVVYFLRECHNCTLRLERQALEWGSAYRFRSCAEVDISQNLLTECSGHGKLSDETGQCICYKRYSGENCQNEDECSEDIDCANGGKCIVGPVSLSRKSCFCNYGYFGLNCNEKSNFLIDESAKEERDGDRCFSYERLVEHNAALKYGIFNVNCFKSFPLNNNDNDFIYARVLKNEVEIILDFVTDSWLGFGWRPLQIPSTCRLFPNLSKESIEQDDSIQYSGYLSSAFNTQLHPMDCIDIIMASIFVDDHENSFLHIRDMYTRDRSTPLSDEYFDGEQSITAAYGRQLNVGNKTQSVIMFRRMIREIEPTDHPLGPGEIFTIYAKGQTSGAYSHLAKSAIEQASIANEKAKNFYRADFWKYHGGENRGVRKLELVSKTEMSNTQSLLRNASSKQHKLQKNQPIITETQIDRQVVEQFHMPTTQYATSTPEDEIFITSLTQSIIVTETSTTATTTNIDNNEKEIIESTSYSTTRSEITSKNYSNPVLKLESFTETSTQHFEESTKSKHSSITHSTSNRILLIAINAFLIVLNMIVY